MESAPPQPAAPPEPVVKQAAAEIERGANGIVIRFPAAAPPRRPRPASAPPAPQPPQPSVRDGSAPPAATPTLEGASADQAPSPRPGPEYGRRPPSTEGRPAEGGTRDRSRDDRPPSARQDRAIAEPIEPRFDVDADAEPSSRSRRRRRRRRRGRGDGGGAAERPADGAAAEPLDQAGESDTGPEAFESPGDVDVESIRDELADVDIGADEQAETEPVGETETEERTEEGRGRRRRRRGRRMRSDSEIADFALSPGPDVIMDAEAEPAAAPEPRSAPAAAARKEMIINVVPHEECRISILEDGRLQEIYLERASAENHVGNIYKGVVTNVEPSIQAAFVDFGLGKNGFLHISDLHPQYFPNGEGNTEDVGRKMPRRHRPPIQRCVRRGQELLVQITKEGIGTKGPTLTTYLSVPGRYLVMMPGMRQLGVSRKIEDDEVRRKIRAVLNELDLPDDIGFIARTAAEGRTRNELQSDLNYLTRLWRAVQNRIRTLRPPAELYRDSDLVIRTIRDVYSPEVARVVVDSEEVAERAREFLGIFSPEAADSVQVYDGREPIFHKFGIEQELERLHSRHVPLKSGGSLVIDQTEALVAIDVNSGRFRTEDDAETTAYKINLEAADEIPRQLRLRDLGGVVVCDFIDMRAERHRREVERRLVNNLKQHKERAKVLRMSAFGIIEMTRQRQRASLQRSVYQDCRHCRGTGLVKTVESVALDAMRLLQLACTRESIRLVELSVSAEVANLLLNRKRGALHALEMEHGRSVSIKSEPAYSLDQVEIRCFDHRGRLVPHS